MAAQNDTDYECRIGDTYYATFAEAFTSADAGDTITMLTDVTCDGASNGQNNLFLSTKSDECNATSLTITSDKEGDERPTLKIVNGGFIVGRASTDSYTLAVENLKIVQDVSKVNFEKSGANSQAFCRIRGGGKLSFENCDITDTCAANSEVFSSYVKVAGDKPQDKSNVNITVNGKLENNADKLIASDLTGTTFNVISGDSFGDYTAPTLMAGASVRTTVGTDGLRFTASLKADAGASKYVIIVTSTTDELTDANFRVASLSGKRYIEITSADDGFKLANKDGYISYNIVLTGLSDPTNEYSARAWAKYHISDSVTVNTYTHYNKEDNSRSVAYVAYKAVNDTKPTATETHGFKIEDGKYSPYRRTQFSLLSEKYASRYDGEEYLPKIEENPWTVAAENGIKVRDIEIETSKGGDDITIVQLTDLHVVWMNTTDYADDVLSSTYADRTWAHVSDSNANDHLDKSLKCLEYFKASDQIVITGDIYDFLTSETVAQVNNYIFNAYDNIMACLGNHEVVKAMGEEKAEGWTETVAERMETIGNAWVNNVYYSSKVLGEKVMLIQMDNGTTGEFWDSQVELFKVGLQDTFTVIFILRLMPWQQTERILLFRSTF